VSVETNLEGKQKVLFEKNIDSVLPIASITKLMTAVVAIDNRTQQNIQLQMMIVGSSNEAANVLAGEVSNFVDLMNQKAREIGLEKTIFADPTGLSSQNISTVKDLAKFTEYILKNYPEIAQISKIKQLYVPRIGIIENTDQLLQEVPDAVCSKTGFTNDAKGCLLLVVRNKQNNDYLINIVLGADDRFVEMRKLISTCKQ
jgi:D-alanyl-D-alanine carboxypeptidase (penicillin-binding protein 5/6)